MGDLLLRGMNSPRSIRGAGGSQIRKPTGTSSDIRLSKNDLESIPARPGEGGAPCLQADGALARPHYCAGPRQPRQAVRPPPQKEEPARSPALTCLAVVAALRTDAPASAHGRPRSIAIASQRYARSAPGFGAMYTTPSRVWWLRRLRTARPVCRTRCPIPACRVDRELQPPRDRR